MKINKLMIVTLLLLAIFAIGAVSASEDTDTLAVEDTDDLSVDESPTDIVSNESYMPEEYSDDVEINVDTEWDYTFDSPSVDNRDNSFKVRTPHEMNGTIVISCNGVELFKKGFLEFDGDSKWLEENGDEYYIYPSELKNNLENVNDDDFVSFAVYQSPDNCTQVRFYKMQWADNTFRLEDPEGFNPWVGDYAALDDNIQEIASIWIEEPDDYEGLLFIEANEIEYMIDPFSRDDGNYYYSFVLSSFNITNAGSYAVTFRYGPDREHSSVIYKGYLEVGEFNGDYFRFDADKENHIFRMFCPYDSSDATVSMFLKHDGDDEYPEEPIKTFTIDDLAGQWKEWTFDELGFEKDSDNVLRIHISNYNDDMEDYEKGMWYDPEYHEFIPDGVTLNIDFRTFDEYMEDALLELYIPENTLIYGGTLNITSGESNLYSRELYVYDSEFYDDERGWYNDEARFYRYQVLFPELDREGLKDGSVVTFAFTTSDGRTFSKSSFVRIYRDEDEEEESIRFTLANFKEGNYLDDEVLIEIVDFPEGVDDEFKVIVDKWGEETELTFNISKLATNENGFYVLACSDLAIDDFMEHMTDADIEFKLIFSNGEEIYGSSWVYKNPYISSGEVSINEEEPVIEFIYLPDALEGSIIIRIDGEVALRFDNREELDDYLAEPEEEEEYDEDYEPRQRWVFALQDLGITDKGTYVLKVEMTKNGKQVIYNNTIEVVDFVIDARNNLDQITSAVFRILLDEDASGNVLIYVDENLVFNKTLEWIGYSDWNRMGGFNIPLNYLQITESGSHDIRLLVQVNDGDKIVKRELNHTINVTVAPNIFEFGDIMYLYGEGNFLYPTSLSYPVPIDSEFVLYLNDALAGRIKIGCDDFKFRDLDESLLDEFGALKPGLYNARLIRVSEQGNMICVEGSFEVKTVNGDFVVDVTQTATTLDGISVEITAPPLPDESDTDNLGLVIFINPYLNEDGELDYEDIVEMWGWELVEYLEENSDVEIGMLPAGTNKLLVQYSLAVDDIEYAMQNPFYSNVLTVSVKKINTQIYASAVSAVYRVAKKLVVTLKDANGKAIAGKKVTIKIGTITRTLTTNRYGQVSLLVSSLVPKSYTAAIRFAGDRFYLGSAKNVRVLVIKAKTALAGKNLKVKAKVSIKKVTAVLKYNGKYVLGSKYVTLKINNKLYKVKTNAKGQAIFKVNNLKRKGSYIGVLMFKADYYFKASSNKVRVVVV